VTDEVFWRKDGTSFPVEYSSTPIYEQERLTGAVVTFEDITERRLLEQQYQQAQKMEAIGRLAGGVAHDFNNLLTAILGYCELLLDELEPTDPRRRDITEIRKAGSRAAELTRQLLAISRKQIIEPKRLDLNAIIVEIRPMLGRVIGEDVIVVLDLSPQLGAVTADHGQVEQVILNLAVNARDAMPNGGTVTIKTADVDINELDAGNVAGVKPGRYVMLAVTDTGTGMTPEVQARVFEPFFTTKPVGQGTGLGLASVYGIVTGAGGAVRVRSAVGKGSSFELLFPLLEGAEAVVKAPPTMLPPRAEGETVLVVDDADGARELIARLLQRQGYAVLVAESPEEAIRLFDANASVDVLLTDVIMPGMSGAALARQLVARRPELKVIYMSGYTDDAVVHHDVLKPGTAFLNKPFDSAALAKKIREVLDR
jgi:signal transduction histidine kinase